MLILFSPVFMEFRSSTSPSTRVLKGAGSCPRRVNIKVIFRSYHFVKIFLDPLIVVYTELFLAGCVYCLICLYNYLMVVGYSFLF